jgi:hypothetical protein
MDGKYFKLGSLALGGAVASIMQDGIRDNDWYSIALIITAFILFVVDYKSE